LKNLAQYLDDPEIDSVRPNDLKRFLLYLRTDYRPNRPGGDDTPLSESAIDNHWKAIRSFWSWAEESLGCKRPDYDLPRTKFQTPVIIPFKESEVKAILQSCSYTRDYNNPLTTKSYRTKRPTAERDSALILLMLDTGLRVSEIARLRIEHIDLPTGAIHILPHGSGQKTKPRIVYLGVSAKRAVWRYLACRDETPQDEPLFLTDEGNTLRENQIRHLLRYLGERAGVRYCHPHRFRHTMAIEFIRNRGDVYSLQRILGHSTLTMCLKYLDLSRDDVAEAHRRASPADNWRL
jgi:integrase/recombinase XerD